MRSIRRSPLRSDAWQRAQILALLQRQQEAAVEPSSIPAAGCGVRDTGPLAAPPVGCPHPGLHFPPLPMVLPKDDRPLSGLR